MTITGQDGNPGRSCSLRIMLLVFFYFTMILLSTYTANLAAFLTLKTAKPLAANVEQLRQAGRDFVVVANSAPASFFNQDAYAAMKVNMKLASSITEAINMVKNDSVYAFVWINTILQIYANKQPCDTLALGEGELVGKVHYGIAMSPFTDPDLRKNLSLGLLRLQEKSVIDALWKKWVNYLTIDCAPYQQPEGEPVDILELQGLFYLLIGGIVISIIIAILERVFHMYYDKKSPIAKVVHDFLGGEDPSSEENSEEFSEPPKKRAKKTKKDSDSEVPSEVQRKNKKKRVSEESEDDIEKKKGKKRKSKEESSAESNKNKRKKELI